MGLFKKIKEGLKKTRDAIVGQIDTMLKSFTKIDEELFEELLELLIMGDVGVTTSEHICDELRKRVKKEGITDPAMIHDLLADVIADMLGDSNELMINTKPSIILVIGVNGVGKTTTIGKIAANLVRSGKKVTVGYKLTLPTGQIVDASEEFVSGAHAAIDFTTGAGQMIPGFDEMVQQMIADMVTKTEAARALVHKACWMQMKGSKQAGLFSAMSKCFASDTAMEVTTTAVQVMGGNGYSRENPNEKYMRDAKIMQIYEGTNQVQRLVIANAAMY